MGPMSAEFHARQGALAWRFLGALGLVAFGLFAMLDASSALVSRLFGGLIVASAALFGWLYVREIVSPGTRLILDPTGLHLRRRPPETDFDGPWSDFYAVRVDRAFDPPRVVVTFVDGLSTLAGECSPATSTELHLPEIIGHPVDDLAAEIARVHKAYAKPRA